MNCLNKKVPGVLFLSILVLCLPAQAMWRQVASCVSSCLRQRSNLVVCSLSALAGAAGFAYAKKTSVSPDAKALATAVPANSALKSKSVVFWGINNVLFHPVQIPWVVRSCGVTQQTFKTMLYKDLQKIPENEITSKAGVLPQSTEPPLAVAWLTGRISCQDAKELVLKHTDAFSISRYIANNAFSAQECVKRLQQNNAMLVLVEQCKGQGHTVGLSSSLNGEVFDALVARNHFLDTDFQVHFISGKQGLMTSDPAFYDALKKKFPHKKIYLIDVPGPALKAAQKKGIIAIEFVASASDAVEKLRVRLQAEKLIA